MAGIVTFDNVSVRYQDAEKPTLSNIDFNINEGELVLISGPTGSGKSTLLGAINGHVPYFTGGTISGQVTVDGHDTRDHKPRDLAGIIGVVAQDPLSGFVTDTVEEELAYSLEQLGIKPSAMRTRIEATLDLLSIAELRDRPLRALSGGQQQRVAIASVLAGGARVLILDEPTSALDPTSAEEVLAALLRLVGDIGVTVLIAEHRLERVIDYADHVLLLDGEGHANLYDPAAAMALSPLVPPIIDLGRWAGWEPLPLTVRDARKTAAKLRRQLVDKNPNNFERIEPPTLVSVPKATKPSSRRAKDPQKPDIRNADSEDICLSVEGLSVSYGAVSAVKNVDLKLPAETITAILGRNGSGKSSLLWALTGIGDRSAGRWRVNEIALSRAKPDEIRQHIRLVPQTATDLLYLDSVAAECAEADDQAGRELGTCAAMLATLSTTIDLTSHPRDLSEGQKLALVLAIQLVSSAQVLLLDEPTRGLDYPAKRALADILMSLAKAGRTIALATHDVEFAAQVADNAVVMATGEVIQTGPVAEVLAPSAVFAPQAAKITYPQGWLTPHQIMTALEKGPRAS